MHKRCKGCKKKEIPIFSKLCTNCEQFITTRHIGEKLHRGPCRRCKVNDLLSLYGFCSLCLISKENYTCSQCKLQKSLRPFTLCNLCNVDIGSTHPICKVCKTLFAAEGYNLCSECIIDFMEKDKDNNNNTSLSTVYFKK